MKFDPKNIFKRPVDLVSKRAIEQSDNPLRKSAILKTAIPIYRQ